MCVGCAQGRLCIAEQAQLSLEGGDRLGLGGQLTSWAGACGVHGVIALTADRHVSVISCLYCNLWQLCSEVAHCTLVVSSAPLTAQLQLVLGGHWSSTGGFMLVTSLTWGRASKPG